MLAIDIKLGQLGKWVNSKLSKDPGVRFEGLRRYFIQTGKVSIERRLALMWSMSMAF